MPDANTQVMQCMEVWGGNQPADSGVVMAGLDAWIYSRPHGDASGGGDVHYVSSCATGRITRLLVADVSGHGAEVSETAAKLRSLMRRYVNYIDQTRFVRALNDEFTALARENRFATAVVTSFFGPRHELSLCNAGHPPPLLYEARTGTWKILEQSRTSQTGMANIPLGILDLTQYEQFSLRLRLGDMVLCYTDSLIEAKDETGQWLGADGLLKIVRSIDVTALLFRHNGLSPRVPFMTRLLAPIRVLAAAIASLRPGADPAPWPEVSLPNIGGAMVNSLSRKNARDDPPPSVHSGS